MFPRSEPRRRTAPALFPERRRMHHPDLSQLQGWKAMRAEADIPGTEWEKEKAWALRMGLTGADSIEDRSIPTFARGELPHYPEDVTEVGHYDATVLGIPFDGGTTYRPGTRFGPQGVRKISALYTPYNYEMAIDLREQMTLCDAGDVFTIPANLEKSFDQISRAVSHVFSSGSLPIMIGGDHSIGFPCVRGIAECTSKKIGIVHFDRHADIQEKDLDERMHTTPWFHSTNLPNVPAKNLVQVGIGGWQVPREAVKVARERETNIITMSDMERMGVDRTAEMALEMAWDGVDMVYMSFDIDSIDCGFVPGTGWPGRHLRHGAGRGQPPLRHLRHHRADGHAGDRGRAGLAGRGRQAGRPQEAHRQARQPADGRVVRGHPRQALGPPEREPLRCPTTTPTITRTAMGTGMGTGMGIPTGTGIPMGPAMTPSTVTATTTPTGTTFTATWTPATRRPSSRS